MVGTWCLAQYLGRLYDHHMSNYGRVILLFVVALFAAGCNSYHYVVSQVTVVDAETGDPIPDVTVSTGYGYGLYGPLFPPSASFGMTDERGVVYLRVSASQERGAYPNWYTESPDYFSYFVDDAKNKAVREVGNLAEVKDTSQVVNVTFRRWRKPTPTVSVVVPNDYRGYVRVQKSPTMPTPPHLRTYDTAVDESGVCQLPGAPILNDAQQRARFEFTFTDGRKIPCPNRKAMPHNWDAGVWDVRSVDGEQVFLIAPEHVVDQELSRGLPYEAYRTRVMQGRITSAP